MPLIKLDFKNPNSFAKISNAFILNKQTRSFDIYTTQKRGMKTWMF